MYMSKLWSKAGGFTYVDTMYRMYLYVWIYALYTLITTLSRIVYRRMNVIAPDVMKASHLHLQNHGNTATWCHSDILRIIDGYRTTPDNLICLLIDFHTASQSSTCKSSVPVKEQSWKSTIQSRKDNNFQLPWWCALSPSPALCALPFSKQASPPLYKILEFHYAALQVKLEPPTWYSYTSDLYQPMTSFDRTAL